MSENNSTTDEETFEFTLEQLSLRAFFSLPERSDDRLVIFVWMIPILYGLIANHLLLLIIMKSSVMRATSSYYFVIEMCLCDLTMLYISIFGTIAYTIFRQSYITDTFSPGNYVPWYIYNSCWWTFVLVLLIMAINRLVCTKWPVSYQNIFSGKFSVVLVVVSAVAGFLIGSPNLNECCYLVWFPEYYSSSYWPMESWYARFDQAFSAISAVIVILCYGIVINELIRARRMVAIISFIYVITFSTWFILPYIGSTKWLYSLMTSLWFVQNATHPTIGLIFNSQVSYLKVSCCSESFRNIVNVFEAF